MALFEMNANRNTLASDYTNMNRDQISYYSNRAAEYDKVYQNPAEQADLAKAARLFQSIFKAKSVLEIACGTGYWTEQLSKTAQSVYACDINQSMLDLARKRKLNQHVRFEIRDIFDLQIQQQFDGLFGGFIWSHISLQVMEQWLDSFKNLIHKDAPLVFIDSKQVEGAFHDKRNLSRIDEFGNHYQIRVLENGASYEVIKNFPNKEWMQKQLSKIAHSIDFIELEYYWIATGKMK